MVQKSDIFFKCDSFRPFFLINTLISVVTSKGCSSFWQTPGKFFDLLVTENLQFMFSTKTQFRSCTIFMMSPCLPLSDPVKICTRSPLNHIQSSSRMGCKNQQPTHLVMLNWTHRLDLNYLDNVWMLFVIKRLMFLPIIIRPRPSRVVIFG